MKVGKLLHTRYRVNDLERTVKLLTVKSSASRKSNATNRRAVRNWYF